MHLEIFLKTASFLLRSWLRLLVALSGSCPKRTGFTRATQLPMDALSSQSHS
jgi:hypothetical protein